MNGSVRLANKKSNLDKLGLQRALFSFVSWQQGRRQEPRRLRC